MKRFIIAFVVLAAILAVVLATQLRRQSAAAEGPAGSSGVIEGTRVAIMPRLGSRVLAVAVREGDTVVKDQVLVTLDCTEPKAALAQAEAAGAAAEAQLRMAEAGVAAAEAAAEAAGAGVATAKAAERGARAGVDVVRVRAAGAKRTVGRFDTLHAGGQTSDRQLDDARTMAKTLGAERRARSAQVAGARAQRDMASAQARAAHEQIASAQARRDAVREDGARAQAVKVSAAAMVAECTLKAPTAGVVQTRAIEVGELARPGMPLLLLVDAREVTATFFLPNAELSAAQPGRAVEVRADAWPDRVWAGTIGRVGAEAAFTPRNVQTRTDRDRLVYPVDVRLANADGALRPGMPVEVVIPGTQPPAAR